MPTYGRQQLGDTGRRIEVAADGFPEWKVGGITIDWATVTAVRNAATVVVEARSTPFTSSTLFFLTRSSAR